MFVSDVIANSSGSKSSAVNTFNLPEHAGISIVGALHTTPLTSWHAFHFKSASSNFTAFYRSVLAIWISLNTMQIQERAALMLSVPTIPMAESNTWLEKSWHCAPEGLVSITPPAVWEGRTDLEAKMHMDDMWLICWLICIKQNVFLLINQLVDNRWSGVFWRRSADDYNRAALFALSY